MEKETNFMMMALLQIEQWREGKSPSTNANYLTALRSFADFTEGKEITLDDLNEPLIKAYEHWLREKGVCLNTISCYMRSLRSLYHQLGGEDDPFRKVFTGMMKTEKRAIAVKDISRLRKLSLRKGSRLELTRDIFLFSVYTLGMPFVDVAYLRKQNLRDGFIVYMRHKTHQTIRVPLEPCMAEIIRKYKRDSSDYIFPIIRSDDSQKAYQQYRNHLGVYNKKLKELAKLAGIEANLTSYVVRHTWASLAYEKNVDLCVISKALGHTNTQTTQIYIREINDERLAAANHTLLASFLE